MRCQPFFKQRRDAVRQTDHGVTRRRCARVAAAWRMAGISWSVRPGMTGATFTPTGMPACASSRMAASRADGGDVRGSMTLRNSASSVVMDSQTAAALMPRQFGQQINVARHQPVLGDDENRIPEFRQHFEATARQFQFRLRPAGNNPSRRS